MSYFILTAFAGAILGYVLGAASALWKLTKRTDPLYEKRNKAAWACYMKVQAENLAWIRGTGKPDKTKPNPLHWYTVSELSNQQMQKAPYLGTLTGL